MTRGFPRPRVTLHGYEGAPTPYTAESPRNPGAIDIDRNAECAYEFLCSLCGEEVTDEFCGIATGDVEKDTSYGVEPFISTDHGLTHPKCATITARMCPAFTDGKHSRPMAMWLVRSEEVIPRIAEIVSEERLLPLRELGEATRVR